MVFDNVQPSVLTMTLGWISDDGWEIFQIIPPRHGKWEYTIVARRCDTI